MAKDTNSSSAILMILWVFDLLIMLLLPFGPSHSLPWVDSPAMHSLQSIVGSVWFIPGAAEHLDKGYSPVAMYAAFTGGAAVVLVGRL